MQSPHNAMPEPPRIEGYRDLEPIATGGFSTVYTAYQETLGRTVAVKVLHADSKDPGARARFQHECELTARLTGRTDIITVFAAGMTADDRFFIAMQYLPNGSLAGRLAATGPLPVTEVLRIGVSIAEALEAAHRAGILHGDIKPGNILVSDRGEPVLSDFGIARLVDRPGPATTVDAFTRGHTAPEVVAGQPPSVRSDLYAVGSTLYALLAGGAPDAAPSASPFVPVGLDGLLLRLLAPDPARRPASAADVAAELRTLLEASLPAPSGRTVTPLARAWTGSVRFGGRRRLIIAAVAAVVLLAGAATAFATAGGGGDGNRPLATQTMPHGKSAVGADLPGRPSVTPPQSSAVPPAGAGSGPGQGSGPVAGQSPSAGPSRVTSSPAQPPPSSAPKPPTSAPPPPTVCTSDAACAGRAYFVVAGAHLFVCDEKSDGYGAVAQYTRTDVPAQNNEAIDKNGYGTCVDHNMNMAQGVKITFRVCLVDSSDKRFDCGTYKTIAA
jgi:serine/threonine-protein kinase PknK